VFEVDTLVASCRESLLESEPRQVVREILVKALERPGPVADRLGRSEGGLEVLFNSPELTVLNVVWAPRMAIYPHDHRMWAVIGIYGGAEDNTLFRRGPQGLVKSGAKVLREGEVLSLGAEAIHSVDNSMARFTGAIHVYGGDFVKQPRSQWDPETLQEQRYDAAQVRRVFEEANASWANEASMLGSEDPADPA
jgi:predicted metal-dependent enzyme (double-stranded beta helix superfamily)